MTLSRQNKERQKKAKRDGEPVFQADWEEVAREELDLAKERSDQVVKRFNNNNTISINIAVIGINITNNNIIKNNFTTLIIMARCCLAGEVWPMIAPQILFSLLATASMDRRVQRRR